MKIGVMHMDDSVRNDGFEVRKTAEFGAVEMYKVSFCKNGGKRRFAREVKKCIKTFLNMGVTVCAAETEFKHLCNGKITFFCSGERVIRQNAGNVAKSFAEVNGICTDIAICGGSFSEAVESSKQILRTRRRVYIRNPAFEDIAEAIYRDVGVSVEQYCGGDFLEVNLSGNGHFLQFGEKFADTEDVSVTIPERFSDGIPGKLIPQLAEILEISGFIRKKEIKVEYFLK